MQKKYRIAILGIGGVGGFVGAKLAAAYGHSAETEVIFIARGDNAQAIKENGLKLITDAGEIIARPDQVAEATELNGEINLLICCTKTYGLADSIAALSASVTPETLVLPLLNGVDNTEKLQALLPQAKVLQGCIYIVSNLSAPGVVQQRGAFYSIHFGGDKALEAESAALAALLGKAGINAVSEAGIREKIWSKFSFISPIATYTSAHNISVGKILENEEHRNALKQLMNELIELAKTQDVQLPADTTEKNFSVMEKLPYEATSSMQLDFKNNRSTELETLTGFVVRKAAEQGILLNSYPALYQLLLKR